MYPKSILDMYRLKFKQLGITDKPWLWAEVARGLVDGGDLSHLNDALSKVELLAAVNPNPCRSEPTAEQVAGNIEIGRTYHNNIAYCLDSLGTAVLILLIAATQRGKSTLIRVLYRAAYGLVKFWFYDHKGDHYHLIKLYPSLKVIRPTSSLCPLRLNPYQPPGPNIHQWLTEAIENFCNAFELLEASASLYGTTLYEMFKANGVFDGSQNYPTVYQHLKYIENMRLNARENYRTLGARDSVMARMRMMLHQLGSVFNCAMGPSVEHFANQDIVWNFSDLSKSTRSYFSMLLAYMLMHYRRGLNDRGKGIKNILVVEEAKDVFPASRDRNSASGLSKASVFVTQCAEFKIAVVISDQDSSAISQIVKDNTVVKWSLGVYGGENLDATAKDMALTIKGGRKVRR